MASSRPFSRTTIRVSLAVFFLSGAAAAQKPTAAALTTLPHLNLPNLLPHLNLPNLMLPDRTLPDVTLPDLGHLTRTSGYIFGGTVTSVARAAAASSGAVATMQITFRVEQAVRGVQTGQILTIHEWAGLWDAGERYHPGEQVMLFLYPPSHLGLTSSIAGSQGRFTIDPSGHIILPPARINAPRPAAGATLRPSSGTTISLRTFLRAIQQAGRE